MAKKFIVLKNEDVLQHLNAFDRKDLIRVLEKIAKGRKLAGKEIDHNYLIINTDEPYAEQVIDIMRDNNHWED